MPSELDRVERWRQLAAEALAAAKELTDSELGQIMLAIAAEYHDLVQSAEECRDNATLSGVIHVPSLRGGVA